MQSQATESERYHWAVASYNKVRLARYVHRLLERSDTLGEIQVAGHDFGGAAVEFAPATQWRHQYSRLFLMDCPITGGTPTLARIPLSTSFPR
jgi:hypothetical protein